MKDSKIEWCDHTVNLWWGCAKVHTGCKNCYAEYFSDTRYKNDLWGEKKKRKRIKSAFPTLDKIQSLGQSTGKMQKVFVGSMMDIFETSKELVVPVDSIHQTMDLRKVLFRLIHFNIYSKIIFLFLTKRPYNIHTMIPEEWKDSGTPKNVWFGTSISDQETADNYIPYLRNSTPKGSNLFLSMEPQVSNITSIDLDGIKWVIQGGESGHKKRPFNIDWAWYMKGWCNQWQVPYFFKQIDKVQEIPQDLMIREFPKEFKL